LDITERHEREERLREAKRDTEEAARLKSSMLANMSHEVRTPLTSMIGFSEILTDELEGSLAQHAQRIGKSGQRHQVREVV
jgi:signal transduction histidine kinase